MRFHSESVEVAAAACGRFPRETTQATGEFCCFIYKRFMGFDAEDITEVCEEANFQQDNQM